MSLKSFSTFLSNIHNYKLQSPKFLLHHDIPFRRALDDRGFKNPFNLYLTHKGARNVHWAYHLDRRFARVPVNLDETNPPPHAPSTWSDFHSSIQSSNLTGASNRRHNAILNSAISSLAPSCTLLVERAYDPVNLWNNEWSKPNEGGKRVAVGFKHMRGKGGELIKNKEQLERAMKNQKRKKSQKVSTSRRGRRKSKRLSSKEEEEEEEEEVDEKEEKDEEEVELEYYSKSGGMIDLVVKSRTSNMANGIEVGGGTSITKTNLLDVLNGRCPHNRPEERVYMEKYEKYSGKTFNVSDHIPVLYCYIHF